LPRINKNQAANGPHDSSCENHAFGKQEIPMEPLFPERNTFLAVRLQIREVHTPYQFGSLVFVATNQCTETMSSMFDLKGKNEEFEDEF
jgi:hypothetical protein